MLAFYVFTKKKEISIETFFIIWNIHFKENIKSFAFNVDIDSKLELVDVSNFNCCFSSLINKTYCKFGYVSKKSSQHVVIDKALVEIIIVCNNLQ